MTNPYPITMYSSEELLNQLVETLKAEKEAAVENEEIITAMMEANLELSTKNSKLEELLEKAHDDVAELEGEVNNLVSKFDQVTGNAEMHMQMLSQGNREKEQMRDKLDAVNLTLKGFKEIENSPKKIRDKIKKYQTDAAANQKAKIAHKKEIKQYRSEAEAFVKEIRELKLTVAQGNITTVWSKDGDHLLLFPTKLTMMVQGKEERQLTLLFMNNSGCGKLIGIDEEGVPQLCQMPKGGLKPKALTLDTAGNILRRFRKSDWKVSHNQLEAIREIVA